jgi:hypothetical protein
LFENLEWRKESRIDVSSTEKVTSSKAYATRHSSSGGRLILKSCQLLMSLEMPIFEGALYLIFFRGVIYVEILHTVL